MCWRNIFIKGPEAVFKVVLAEVFVESSETTFTLTTPHHSSGLFTQALGVSRPQDTALVWSNSAEIR